MRGLLPPSAGGFEILFEEEGVIESPVNRDPVSFKEVDTSKPVFELAPTGCLRCYV